MEMVKSGIESHRMFLDRDLQRYLLLKGNSENGEFVRGREHDPAIAWDSLTALLSMTSVPKLTELIFLF